MSHKVLVPLLALLLAPMLAALGAPDLKELIDISGGNHSPLEKRFNDTADNVRMVLILSPS